VGKFKQIKIQETEVNYVLAKNLIDLKKSYLKRFKILNKIRRVKGLTK